MSIYDYTVKARKGATLNLNDLKGKVLLIVNTATGAAHPHCTRRWRRCTRSIRPGPGGAGLPLQPVRPSRRFGDEGEIHEFCTAKYQTQFDQLAKIDVNGETEEPLFTFLKQAQPDEKVEGMKNERAMAVVSKISTTCKKENDIKWNFTKFLVDRQGNVVKALPADHLSCRAGPRR